MSTVKPIRFMRRTPTGVYQECWTPNNVGDIHKADALVMPIIRGYYQEVGDFIASQNDDIGCAMYITEVIMKGNTIPEKLKAIIEIALD